jgi:nucleoside transporter
MTGAIRTRLSVMMFLEYVIWGAWLPLLNVYLGKDYLGFNDLQAAWIQNTFAIASLIGMFFGGQLADRYLAQEKFLAISHLLGGLAILGMAFVKDFWPCFALMMVHCFFYVPTLSVTNAISFANLRDSQDFGKVRLWGTIGWIAASWPLLFLPAGSARVTFFMAAVASLVLSVFCLTLPHTPPVKGEESAFAPFKALSVMGISSIAVLFVVTFFDSLVHYAHFFWTGRYLKALGLPENWVPAVMGIGQVMEIVAMAVLGLFLKRLGWRTTMIIGILGQALRFGAYSIGAPETLWLIIAINVVHGFAYACFFATVYIFVDENFPKDIRTSAQSLFNLNILGIAPLVSNFLSGALGASGWFGDDQDFNYNRFFLLPLGVAIFAAVLLAVFFHPPKKPADQTVDAFGEPLPIAS